MQLEAEQQTIAGQYRSENPTSESLYHEQAKYVPSGVSHSSRSFSPFPLFIEACLGARKWDVDGHEYLDYWLGHGSNLLGHAHPVVVAAVREQLEKGFHAGGETRLAVTWAELVCRLVPSADLVRFTTSGGEATQLALRTARRRDREGQGSQVPAPLSRVARRRRDRHLASLGRAICPGRAGLGAAGHDRDSL